MKTNLIIQAIEKQPLLGRGAYEHKGAYCAIGAMSVFAGLKIDPLFNTRSIQDVASCGGLDFVVGLQDFYRISLPGLIWLQIVNDEYVDTEHRKDVVLRAISSEKFERYSI